MKNLKMLFASFALLALSTIFASNVKAQSFDYYIYNPSFNCFQTSPALPSTTPLAVTTNYTKQTGPIIDDPCDGGNYLCGFRVTPQIPVPDNNNVIQCVLDAIKALADARQATTPNPTTPYLDHNNTGTPITVSCSGTTYTIVTYRRSV